MGSNLEGAGGPGADGVAKNKLIDPCDIMSTLIFLRAGETSDRVLCLPLGFGGIDGRLGFMDVRVEVLLFSIRRRDGSKVFLCRENYTTQGRERKCTH